MIFQVVAKNAAQQSRLHYTNPEPGSVTLDELLSTAEGGAAALAVALATDAQPRIGLLMANGEPWIRTFLAVMRLGGVAVPLAVPASFKNLDGYQAHVGRIAKDAELDAIVFDDTVVPAIAGLETTCAGVRFVHQSAVVADARHPVPPDASADPERLAVLQYTSGSTSAPKGVQLTARNVLAGIHPITHDTAWDPAVDVMGVWIPLFHDMGLFGAVATLTRGSGLCLWTPAEFVKRPMTWLRSFAASPATALASPNFFFDYLTAAAAADPADGVDLSRWRVAFNGAEQVRWGSVTEFTKQFAPLGFRPATMYPVYGMAEATLPVTFPAIGDLPHRRELDRRAIGAGAGERSVVCVGKPVTGMEVRIDGAATGSGPVIGEVQVRGTAVMVGYLNVPAAEQPFTADGWLKTGDLGFLDEHGLYITGRAKDMIVVNGENYHAEDIEEVVHGSPGLDRRHCAAVPWTDDDGRESMLVLVETARTGQEAEDLAEGLRRAITAQIGLPAVWVRPVAPKSLPYTSSGKIQRRKAREQVQL